LVSTKKVITKKELWGFGIAALGQGMIYAMMSSYISDFYVNVLRTPLIFGLFLMLFARIWDSAIDPFIGMFIDRTNTRWGKMKPYTIFAGIPIVLLTIFMYYVPSFSNADSANYSKVGTMVFAALIYVFWGMTYSVADVPFWSLPNVMTGDPQERGSTISFGRTLNGIGSAFPMIIWMLLGMTYNKSGDDETTKKTYLIMAIICSLLGMAMYLISTFTSKERINVPHVPRKKGEATALKRMFQCKPLVLIIIMGVLSSGRYLVQAASIHVARYSFIIEGMEYGASVSLVSTIYMVCAAVGMFGAMLCMPALYKRFNYKQIIIVTSIGGFIAGVITMIIGIAGIYGGFEKYALFVSIPFLIIECIPLGAINITSYAMIGDAIDYMEVKTGFRDAALSSAFQGFINQLGNALATSFVILMYIILAINPENMVRSGTVENMGIMESFARNLDKGQRLGMFALISILPGVSLLLCTIPVFFYDLVGKKRDEITEAVARIRATEIVEDHLDITDETTTEEVFDDVSPEAAPIVSVNAEIDALLNENGDKED
jgi:Na+/melibiose symporter-like transporter